MCRPKRSINWNEIPTEEIKCIKCGKLQSPKMYGWVRRGESGKYNCNSRQCRDCVLEHSSHKAQLKRIYPYPKNSKCQCCGKVEKSLHLDHDYKNKKFRGYLCNSCNTGLGKLGDNKIGLKRALRYLEKADLIKQIPIKRTNASVHNIKNKK
jgi:hypothetical protein